MITQHHGSCLCGAVRFEIRGTFERFYLCHCSHCRKDTGSAHAANLFSRDATLTWLAGEDHVTTYALPATRHAKSFCRTCGSAMPRFHAGTTSIVCPAGSLDGPLAMRPDAHLFVTSRADWDHELESVPQLERGPTR